MVKFWVEILRCLQCNRSTRQRRVIASLQDPGSKWSLHEWLDHTDNRIQTGIFEEPENTDLEHICTALFLKKIHEPFEKLSDRQIRKARAHTKNVGAGFNLNKMPHRRVRIDLVKLDNFLSFVDQPYFYQDVGYGTRTWLWGSSRHAKCHQKCWTINNDWTVS